MQMDSAPEFDGDDHSSVVLDQPETPGDPFSRLLDGQPALVRRLRPQHWIGLLALAVAIGLIAAVIPRLISVEGPVAQSSSPARSSAPARPTADRRVSAPATPAGSAHPTTRPGSTTAAPQAAATPRTAAPTTTAATTTGRGWGGWGRRYGGRFGWTFGAIVIG